MDCFSFMLHALESIPARLIGECKAICLLQETHTRVSEVQSGKSIKGLLYVSTNFPFTTSEKEQDYYQEIVNLQVSSRVGQQFTFWICLELKVSAQPTTQIKILTVVVKKLALKVSIEKPFLLYFVSLSAGL